MDELQKKVKCVIPPHLKSVAALPCEISMFSCIAIHKPECAHCQMLISVYDEKIVGVSVL